MVMSHKDHHHKHTALMLLACAFAFVYLLAWQFQWSDIVRRWNGSTPTALILDTGSPSTLPARLESVDEDSYPTGQNISWETKTIQNTPSPNISFTSLNAVPQSFMRLGVASSAGIMMDTQRVIITTNTNTIKRAGESKTLTAEQIKQIWLKVDSLTFYNDPSWANILVLMEVVRNNQSLLIQAPYAVYRDNKAHLNSLIAQLTQK